MCGACAGELADEELARKLQAEEDARASRRSERASRLAAATARSRRSTRSAAPVGDASTEVVPSQPFPSVALQRQTGREAEFLIFSITD